MGAAGGVAALPLAQAGLKVIGLEAGTWLTSKDFAPDELRNNYRAWPQSVQKANREVPTHRPERLRSVFAAPGVSPDDERRRRHVAALLGAELAAESVGLQGRQRNDEALRRVAHARRIDGGRLAVRHRGDRALLRHRRARARRVGQGGQHRGQDRSPRQHLRSAAPPRVSDAAAAVDRLARQDGCGCAQRSDGIRFPGRPRSTRAPTRIGPGCAYHGFCARGGCHVNAKGSTAVTTIPKAQKTGNLDVVTEAHVTEVNVDGNGRVTGVTYVKGTEVFFQPASVVLLATYTYENVRTLLLSKSKAFPNGLANNRGQVGRHYMTHATGGSVQALFSGEPQQLVRPARAGGCRRRFRRRQLRSLERSISSAAETCSCIRIGGRSAPPA